MPHHIAALPFTFTRSTDAYSVKEYTSTTETAHGLLRIEGDRLVVQWRVSRTTDRMGMGYESKEELEPVKETSVPLNELAAARIRRSWSLLGKGTPHLVLTATDLRTFEAVAGPTGLALAHPSQLEFTLAKRDGEAGEEFASELELAISEYQLRLAEGTSSPALPVARAERLETGNGR